MNLRARLAARLPVRDESGWLIVEVMISAVVLVLAGLAIYSGLDGASSASGRNRNRTMAATLAQQDQERMRSMDASALNAYIKTPYTQSITVGGLTYSVTSNVAYATDNTEQHQLHQRVDARQLPEDQLDRHRPDEQEQAGHDRQPPVPAGRPQRRRRADRQPHGHHWGPGHPGRPR